MNISASNSVIPGNIKRIIANKGLKNSYVAKRIGVSSAAFSSMLNGRKLILIRDVINIAAVLEIPPDYLFATDTAESRELVDM